MIDKDMMKMLTKELLMLQSIGMIFFRLRGMKLMLNLKKMLELPKNHKQEHKHNMMKLKKTRKTLKKERDS